MQEQVWSVSDFVAVLNQTLEFSYPSIIISGELANFRVSKNRWVYFDLKDETASVRFFGTVYNLPAPLEDGMLLQVRGVPRLHPAYGFSITTQTIQPVGEGTIKRAAKLLQAKLTAEGLFDEARKRTLPYPPQRVGLITSSESAAYHDFIKILNERWGGIEINLVDVAVQGELAVSQITAALSYFETHHAPVDIIVLTRGGGSPEDLAAFSTEQVTRAVAGSRIPTLVAIGHEIDISLAELVADQRASTPSNAAQLLVPDKRYVLEQLHQSRLQLTQSIEVKFSEARLLLDKARVDCFGRCLDILHEQQQSLILKKRLLSAFNPSAALKRGFAIARGLNDKIIFSGKQLKIGERLSLQLSDAFVDTKVEKINLK